MYACLSEALDHVLRVFCFHLTYISYYKTFFKGEILTLKSAAVITCIGFSMFYIYCLKLSDHGLNPFVSLKCQ